jgi:SAM-dependent methyltransferase
MGKVDQHLQEMMLNQQRLLKKPLLAKVYGEFHQAMKEHIPICGGLVVELGSGVANICEVIPECVRTDLTIREGIDRVENAYALTFADSSCSALLLFDVFHHLRFPGTAIKEFRRVLVPGGRIILIEPYISVLGRIVYGCLHPEPIALYDRIEMFAPSGWCSRDIDYYAAQGNATRLFSRCGEQVSEFGLNLALLKRWSAISYILSGGYSKPQMYPTKFHAVMKHIEKVFDCFPGVFATRMLVVLEKPFEGFCEDS